MGQLADLKPTKKARIIDLVEEAGLDVSDWANFSRGAKWAGANPKYCYEWSFVEPGRLVVLNLWHKALRESSGRVSWSGNPREWFLDPSLRSAKSVWRRRAESFDRALQEASTTTLPLRVIVNDGEMRASNDPNAQASVVQRRLLDPLPWSVTSYDPKSGQCRLIRGESPRGNADQFDLSAGSDGPETRRVDVASSIFVRDPALRAAALMRANGRCEYCLRPGFTTIDGRVFLETHHVIPLSEGGPDSAANVAAVCANHHREAHFGARAEVIRRVLLNRIGAPR